MHCSAHSAASGEEISFSESQSSQTPKKSCMNPMKVPPHHPGMIVLAVEQKCMQYMAISLSCTQFDTAQHHTANYPHNLQTSSSLRQKCINDTEMQCIETICHSPIQMSICTLVHQNKICCALQIFRVNGHIIWAITTAQYYTARRCNSSAILHIPGSLACRIRWGTSQTSDAKTMNKKTENLAQATREYCSQAFTEVHK